MPILQFFSGDNLIFARTLLGNRILIGRSQRCDICLPAPEISRTHCVLDPRPNGYLLINRSRFGTVVPGKSGERVPLSDGDIFEIADYRVKYLENLEQQQSEKSTLKRPNPLANRPQVQVKSPIPEPKTRQGQSDREAASSNATKIVGESREMQRVVRDLMKMANHDAPVLITGESGTGKEVTARAVHAHSAKGSGPFIAINCAAIANNLFESELFGHEKGAFSGADSRKDGAFLAADGGTLFLDEIGELRYDLQAKLLRVLETGEVRRVGSTTVLKPSVRIIAATNRSLAQMVRERTFREDLLYRLSILTLRLPPLRERLEDIPELSSALLRRYHHEAVLTEDALSSLNAHHWPGNVRELRNVLLRALIMHGPTLEAHHFEFNQWFVDTPTVARARLDRSTLEAALQRHEGNRTRTAKELGIPRSTLIYKIKHWEIAA